MGLVFQILLLFVAVSLDGGDCGVFVKTIRERRALLPNITSGRPTTFNHVYNIKLPHCKTCSANISKPLARIFEAQDEARDDKRFEHTVDPANQVVFTHRINIPPQACGCDDALALLSRLEALEKQVATLRRQCSSNACCGAKRAMDCGAHGTFSPSTCGCVCEEGWSGPTCSKASCPVNCHPHQGDCVAGRCVCHEGFTGEDCSKEICPDDCNDQGRCIDDKCVCFPGYTGYGCTEEICPDDCKGRGKCVDGNCVCNKGYSGFDCGVKDCPGDCSDQGHCVEGKCVCNAGFSGRDCGLRDCPANCHGHGNCIKGKCVCKKGFTGTDCAVKACPQNCNDRGRCVNGKCVCNTGYSGPSCGVQTCPDNCNQRGKCVNGKCVCNTGYSGSSCSVQTCPDNCNQQGKCANGKCVCNTGYSGSSCSVQTCPDNCNQQGKCVNGKCVCNTGYSGSSCSVQTCPDNCNQQGKCVNGKCVCNTGYSGPSCGVQTCPDNCNQRGKCVNGKCVCNTGYSGPKCGVQNCPNNCNNQGRCTEGKCICKDGFTGNDCSIEIPTPAGLHVKKILETKATVGWQLPQVPVDTWEITFRPLKEDNGKLTNRLAGSKSSFQQIGLASGQEYEVTLRAEKDKKLGPAVSRTFTTLIDGPRNLHVVSATNSTIKLGWKKPQASIDHYRLNYSSATGKHSQVVVPPGDNSAILTGLEAGVEHTISLVGERGGHQSKAAATKGTTGLTQRKLAVSHSTPTVATNENQFIQDISRAISRKIAAAEISADVGMTARSIIRRYPAFAKSPTGSPKVFLGTPPARVKVSSERGQIAKESKNGKGPIRKIQGPTLVGPGRFVGPGRKVTGSPGIPPILKHKKGPAGSPSSNGAQETSLNAQRTSKGPETPLHTGTPEPTKQEILGGKDKTENSSSSRLTSKIYLPPLGRSRKPIVSRASATGSKESPNPFTLNATSRHVVLSWDITEGLFDTLLLSYRDPSTNTVLSEVALGGDQRTANITGLTIGKSYEVSLYGTSGSNPSQPIHITEVAVPGSDEGPVTVNMDSTTLQSAQAKTQGKGSEEEEDEVEDEEDEEEEEEEEEEVRQEVPELPATLGTEPEDLATSNSASENLTPSAFKHSLVSPKNSTVSNSSQTQAPNDLRPFDLSGLTPAVNSNITHQVVTDDKLSAPLTDQVASFRNVTVRDITAKAFRLSWKVPEGAFDSFVIQYRVSTSSARWEERKVQGRFRSAVLKGLSPATKYTVRLYGVREGQRTGPFTLDATTDSTEKVKPGDVGKLDGLTSSNITDRSLQLTWSAQKDFDTFHVHYRVDGSKDVQKLKLPGNLRSSIITGLRPSTKYTIYLYGVSSGQRTKPITTIATTADKEAVKLGSLSTSNITANSLRLSWTVDRAFDSFLIQYRVQGSEETHNITVTGGRRSHRIAGLRPTTRYTVYLYGISGGSRTEPLTTAVTTTERPQQSEVSDLSVSNITADSLQLSWVTEGEYDSFFIEYGAEEDQAMQNFTVTGAHRSSIITGLRPTTAYTFYLYGVSAGQRTKPLTAVATTKASTDRDKVKPSKVVKLENLSVSNITADSFQLSWSAEKDFDSFIIEYGVQGSEDVQNVMVTGDRRLSLITGLRPTTVYTVYVYGISGGVRTKPLSTIITTKASTGGDKVKPSKVIKLENLSVSNITMDSFQLSWGAEKVFDSFIIQYGVQGSEDVQNLTVTGDRRLSLITGLRPTTIYTVYVYGISGGVRTKPLSTVITTKASTDRDKVKPSKVIKLENLSVSNITVGSFQLSWGAEKDFDSFIIQYRVRGSEDVQNLTVTGDRRLSLITGLRPTTIYTVYVYGISGGVRTKPLSTVITTKASTDRDKVKPSKVVKLENLSVSNITANSFQLSWGAEKDFDSFMIQYGVRGSEDVQDLTVTGDRRLSLITGLRPTTIYTVYVYGISGGVRTKPLSTVITTKGKGKPKPSKLGGLLVSNVSSDSIPFSWMAEKGFDAFLIRYKVHGSGVVQNFTVNSDDRSTTITGLRPRTKYTVYVYGVYNGKRTKPLTRVVTTKAPTDKEAVKLGSLSTSNITANSLRLSWTVDRAFDSFLIQYRVQGSEETHNITVTGGQQSHRIVGLRPTTRYTVYLYGISGGSRTEPLTTAVTTTGDRETVTPVRLGSLSTTNITANSLRLSWTVDRAFDSFLIQYRVQGSEETHNITVAGEQQSHLIVGLRPAARYTVYLYGIFNGKLTKPLTTAVTTTVSIDTNGVKPSRLSKLIRLSGNNVTQDSLQIFWAAESGFDSFLIQYRVDGSEEVRNFTVPAHQQSSFIEGLRPSTKYLISLYGFSGSRRTRPLTTIITTAASADKEGEKSGKFGSLSFSNITADSLLLSWTAETIFDSFLIQYKSQGSETLQNITVTGDRRSTYITGLRPTTNYTIYLYGVSGGQLSRPLVALLTITAVPVHTAGFSTLGRLLVSNIDTHSLKLSWTVEEGAFDSFLVQYRDSQGRLGVKEVTVPGNLRNVTIADLIPSTEYLISLYGVLKNQQTEPIPIVARTARESRSRLRFTDLRDTSVTVHWAAPSAPVKTFKIFYVPTKQGAPRSAIIDGRKTNITLKGLVPDTKYEINLVAVQGAIESPPILDHFTTAPDAPSDLKAVNVSDTMALLVWRPAIAPINHYVITYSGQNVPTVSKNVPGNTAELQLTGLNMNTEYKAEIHSVKGDRKSPRISTSFVTGSDLPRDLTVRDISSTEGLVSWKSPRSPVTGYLLVYETEGSEAQQVKLDPVATSHRLRQLLPSTRYTVRLHALRDGERMAAITAYFSTVGARIPFPKDCGEERSNGRAESSVVTLYLNGNKDKPIKAYCDMSTNGGGWMVFQRRKNGKTNFMRNWKAYATGFGDLAGEHWLGLEYLHQMTSQQRYELRVDLRNDDESAYATYDNFVVESPAQKYKLKVGKYAGNAGNSLSYHHGSSFTTLDSDSDEALTNCAVSYRGGWWYKNCHRVNLNGEYGNNRDHQGVNWYGWKGFEFSIPFTEMKMRPYNFARAVRKE
ncbi:tenascin-like isoform X4 [Carcharodon carcharias]|uniref:tenascin-like isoform X4 n=1 Tax=Carcharodon carcharias TaxID=13397 RepID=UPI001B7DEE8D|nr:tenascin-like isoform X4 [Carcharodon carcharias]